MQLMLGLSPEMQSKAIATFCIIIIFLITRSIAFGILKRSVNDLKKLAFWKRGVTYTITIILILLLSQVWYNSDFSLATFLGILGAAITVVLKDVMINIAGWIYILWRRPFRVGDRIEINNIKGDVIDVMTMSFIIAETGHSSYSDQLTGRIVHIPNSMIFTHPLANYTLGFEYIWYEIPVTITFESNWKKAKKLLTDILHHHTAAFAEDAAGQISSASAEYQLLYKNTSPSVITKVGDSGVILAMRFLIKPKRRREVEEKLWEEVLNALAVNRDIELAYPTNRVYRANEENK